MPRLIILSHVDDEGVRVDISRAYASISSNAQCQVRSDRVKKVLSEAQATPKAETSPSAITVFSPV